MNANFFFGIFYRNLVITYTNAIIEQYNKKTFKKKKNMTGWLTRSKIFKSSSHWYFILWQFVVRAWKSLICTWHIDSLKCSIYYLCDTCSQNMAKFCNNWKNHNVHRVVARIIIYIYRYIMEKRFCFYYRMLTRLLLKYLFEIRRILKLHTFHTIYLFKQKYIYFFFCLRIE